MVGLPSRRLCASLVVLLAALVIAAQARPTVRVGGTTGSAYAPIRVKPDANGTMHCAGECQLEDLRSRMSNHVMAIKAKEHLKCVEEHRCPLHVAAESGVSCKDGHAGEYECSNVDLLALVPVEELGANQDLSDIWGWTDPVTGQEIAIVCMASGTSFVDVSNPTKPAVLAFMPAPKPYVIWRDVKVFNDHAFVVSETANHGMQVLDLTTLRGMKAAVDKSKIPQIKPTVHYAEFGSCHNIVINEESGFAYAVGTKTCRGGLHMMDISDPVDPKFVGCYADDGYTHDAQCVNYEGPDASFHGHEICFNYNEDTLTIVDVSDKSDPKMLSRVPYNGAHYTHQGWLTNDLGHLLLNDELDELEGTNPHTRTMMWKCDDLTKPSLVGSFYAAHKSIDHNLYTLGDVAYLANYCDGLRILSTKDVASKAEMQEIAFFDVAPDCDEVAFHGSWSNYPYFKSGIVVVSSIERGLFVLRPNLPAV